VYARISSDDLRDGLGVERQLADLRGYCDREGWAPVEYVDNDIGASTYSSKKRPAFTRMLADVQAGTVDVVVVMELSRFTRDPGVVEGLIRAQDGGVRLHSLQGGEYDPETATGKMRLRTEAMVAASYADFVSDKVRRKKEELVESGRGPGGSRAFGYLGADPATGRRAGTVIDKREAAAYKRALADVLAGATLTSIAERWNDAGLRTPKTGSLWKVPSVRVTLLNPRHAGLLARSIERDGRKVYDIIGETSDWSRIISVEDHDRITRLLLDPDRRHKNPPRRGLLTGLVTCHCGARMRRDGRTYRCDPAPETRACGHNMILADTLDEKIEEALLYRLTSPAVVKAMTRPKQTRTARKGENPEKIQAELDELADLAGRGELPMREYLIVRKPLEARLAKALDDRGRDEVAPTAAADIAKAPNVAKAWKSATPDRRRQILRDMIEQITIGPKTKTAKGFDYDRLDIAWKT
jgi:site-specific DNA recombinase